MELKNMFAEMNSSDVRKIYNVMGVVRGCDDKEEIKYKTITTAIRSYLGFGYGASGDLLRNWFIYRRYLVTPEEEAKNYEINTYEEFAKRVIALIEEVYNAPFGCDTHYTNHLYYAISSIGKDKLVQFITNYDINAPLPNEVKVDRS